MNSAMNTAINNAAKTLNAPKPTNNQMAYLRVGAGIVFVILALVAIYYLYKYLYGEVEGASFKLVNGPQAIKSGASAAKIFNQKQFAQITEGGEYSVSFWAYVNKWESSKPKPIIRIGGGTATPERFDSLAIYLDHTVNTLHVRVDAGASGSTTSTKLKGPELYSTHQESQKCDISNFDLQRWVHVTVSLNGNTTDVYIDGKLARSCVNQSYFRVDNNTQLYLMEDVVATGTAAGAVQNGLNGYVSNVITYNYSLNPDEVYRNYMTGPDASYTALSYLLSFFNPGAYGEGVTAVKT